MLTRNLGILIAGCLIAPANADVFYSGTWEISGQAAGTMTIRVTDDRLSGALVGNTGKRRNGHMHGTWQGKRFKVTVRLSNGQRFEFQGNFTHNEAEAHMDGLQYVNNKPVDDVKMTSNLTIVSGR